MGRTDYFGGLIDEVALYDTTLSASDSRPLPEPRDMQERACASISAWMRATATA
jgi:hypothetical protein